MSAMTSPTQIPRAAGLTQGWVLVATTWLAVAAAAVLAPVAPEMAGYFKTVPHAAGLVQISIGLPALFVALLGFPFGLLADRIGRRRILVTALLCYAGFGMLPFFLHSLPLILATRAGVGMSEAAVLASSMALLGDYFEGAARDHWAAIQGGTATVAAIIFLSLSSALGGTNWRLSFLIYAAPVIIAAFILRTIWEPKRQKGFPATSNQVASAIGTADSSSRLFVTCAVTVFAGISFYIVLIQLPFLLAARGFGLAAGAFGVIACAATAPFGAAIFRFMRNTAVTTRLALSFVLSALGLLLIAVTPSYLVSLGGAAINGLGFGIVLPSLITWALAGVPYAARGRASGLWNASFFLGQFFSPIVFLTVAGIAGGAASAMAVAAAALSLAAAISYLSGLQNARLLRMRGTV